MELDTNFRELLESFNAERVDYLVVGGHALAFHGAPRFTGDLDLLVKTELANAKRVMAALKRFGFGSLKLSPADFAKPDAIVQLGRTPLRIDIMTSITGVTWQKARRNCTPGECGGVPVLFLSRADFIANKRASGRAKDIADIEALESKPARRARR